MSNDNTTLVTVEELQKILGIGRNTAYRLLNQNKIKCLRIGKLWKIPKSAIDEYISAQSDLHANDH